MIERRGRVLRRDRALAEVAIPAAAGCARCEAGRGCGQGLLFRWFTGDRPIHVRLPLAPRFAVGDAVAVSISSAALTRVALLAYGAPLALLLAGLAGGTALAGEAGALVGAAAGLATGVLLLRRIGRPGSGLLVVEAADG